jgi:serine phosphatase RsbU (regulator of sigma subunit)
LAILLLIASALQANTLVDSLENALSKSRNDSEKVMLMTKLVTEYSTMDPDKAADYCSKAVKLAETLNDPSLKVFTLISQCAVYNTRSNFDGSLELGLKALKIADQAKDNDLIARCYNNIGFTYMKLRDNKTALVCLYKARNLRQFLTDKKLEGNLYNNLGNCYHDINELDSAMFYHKKALDVRLLIRDMRGISYSYNNIGNVYIEQKKADKALEYYIKSIGIKQEIGDMKGIAGGYINIAGVYLDLKDFPSAARFAEQGLKIAAQIHAKDFMLEGLQASAEAYTGLGDNKKANEFLHRYIGLKDSLYNDNIAMQIAEMQAKYENDKKEREIELQQAQIKNKEAEIMKKNATIWGTVGGGFLLLIAIGLMYSRYLIKQRANAKLEVANDQLQHLNEIVNRRNQEIERQSEEIKGKNKDITDSIVYAKRIQSAIMPPASDLQRFVPNSFIYYKPRDIVSGDFYWFHHLQTSDDELFIIACADCTGHGVPGAFMSMICVQLLNMVVRDSQVTAPEHALQQLDNGVRRALRQSGSDHETADGMDVALCAISLKKNYIMYAGAFRPLYIIRNGQLLEHEANKFSIGGYGITDKKFTGHTIDLQKGDHIFLSTDGYADQFGGPEGKKFKVKNFKKLLLSIAGKDVAEQQRVIERTMDEWKKDQDQLDDILVIGMSI